MWFGFQPGCQCEDAGDLYEREVFDGEEAFRMNDGWGRFGA